MLSSAVMKNSSEAKDEMVIAIVWYRPEQWQRVRDSATDGDDFEGSYFEWLQVAEAKLNEIRLRGLRAEKVEVDSEKLILWCNEHGLENNREARSRYAAERLSKLDQNRSLIERRT